MKHKHTLTESFMISWWNKNLTISYYVTKDHIAMHTTLFHSKLKVIGYTALVLLTLIRLVSVICFNSKTTTIS